MDEKSSQIIDDIETSRAKLGENLSDLESRVRQVTDWRTHYERYPFLFIGAALGGGYLLSGLLSRNSSNGNSARYYSGPVSEAVDKVRNALVEYGTTKAKDVLSSVLPGFRDYVQNL